MSKSTRKKIKRLHLDLPGKPKPPKSAMTLWLAEARLKIGNKFIRKKIDSNGEIGDNKDIAKICGKLWDTLPQDEKATWKLKAREEQQRHNMEYKEWESSPEIVEAVKQENRRSGH